MPYASLALGCLPYLTATVLALGLARRLTRWRRAKAPPAPLFPAATSRPAAWAGIGREICLLGGRRTVWTVGIAAAWALHAALALMALGHLRVLTDFPRLWARLGLAPQAVDRLASVCGTLLGLVALAAVLVLALRRLTVPGLRAITRPGDALSLALLGAVLASGLAMRLAGQADLGPVRAYFAALARLRPVPLPDVPGFAAHFLLAQALAVALPFSKLLHTLGVFPAKAGLVADSGGLPAGT
ncbi:MAG: respiratory nitrate reductase subunit gamma [Solidesulfovibrio sp. DCME]|uniref:respiratory nitrate reductase subunit gamma n=1 Tax=Solidesulfovibrio sp. DCME TaxID=3447380 RepID=UPI003D0B7934